MSAKSTNLNMYLLLGLLLSILGCNSAMVPIKKALAPDPNSLPVKTLTISMDIDQREELFSQLQSFASQHSLELTTFYGANRKDFFFVLTGDGFHISVLNTTISPGEINIPFYNEASPPVSQETINKLAMDLKNSLNKIPNIIIKEKLKRLKITMDKNQGQELSTEFFTQLQNFANRQSLKFIVLTPYDPELRTFLVEMDGDGFQITCDAVRNVPGETNVDFYIHYADNGYSTPISQKTIDELFADLESYFSKIPNVIIVEEK
jgi:hypothetical protein